MFERIYNCYQSVLHSSNALDFEDMLIRGLDVLKAKPEAIAHLGHVLVDELWVTSC